MTKTKKLSLQYQVLTSMQNKWKSHILLIVIQNGTATPGNVLTVSDKVKHTLTTLPRYPTPKKPPYINENLCSQKHECL